MEWNANRSGAGATAAAAAEREEIVLDDRLAHWLARIAELGGDGPPALDAVAQREASRVLSDALFAEFGVDDEAGVVRRTLRIPTLVGELRLDEYRPAVAAGPLPAYLLLHGGAFRLGSIDERINVSLCSQRARESRFAVYSLEYRLAPEHPFPAALDDAEAALSWLRVQAWALGNDPGRLVLGGVSAGGNLAAATAMRLRDRGDEWLHGLLLEVPALDLRSPGSWLGAYAAVNGFTDPESLRAGYVDDDVSDLPAASPLLAALHDLPPTHVMTSEYDPLRAGGELFARRLREAGNDASATRHLGQLHGTQGLTAVLREARLWHAEVVAVLREFAA